MAALKKEVPSKSFFSSSSHTFKKLVNAFPKAQKQSHHSSQQQQQQQTNIQQQLEQPRQQKLAVECESEDEDEDDDEDEEEEDDKNGVAELDVNDGYGGESVHKPIGPAAEEDGGDVDNGVDDDTEYSDSSEGEYPRPRIREDLLPHDFSAWQKSPSIAPYPQSEASSTSREAETFSEVLSSSTSQDRYPYSQDKHSLQGQHHRTNNRAEYSRRPSHIDSCRNPSPSLASAMESSPATDLHLHQVRQNLPDLKLDVISHGGSGGCRYGGPAGLKSLPEGCWSVRNGTSENGRRNSVDGSCWQRRKVTDPVMQGGRLREMIQDGGAFYQNLVEMMPGIETYREHQEDGHQRGNFQHHASMVYTLAPSREALAKKVADSMNSRRASRNMRRVKKKSDAMWEEQENVPRRVKANDLSCSPRRVSYENSVDIAKLQGQVEELQRKLIVREGMLQSYHFGVEQKDENSEELLLLMRRVEELQRRGSEKDQMLERAKETLAQKENDIQAMRRLLQDTEETCVGLRARNANSEEEVRALRCEVAALRWQMEIDAEKARSETEASVQDGNGTKNQDSDVRKQVDETEVCELEAIRKMYLASLVVARHVQMEECLALVGVLRIQLQHMLRISTFHLQ